MRQRFSIAEKNEMAMLYFEGQSSTNIADTYGTNHKAVLRYVRNAGGLVRSIRETRHWSISPVDYPIIAKLYQAGARQGEIARKYKVSRGLICLILKKRMNGIKRNCYRKYKLNEHCFDILSEQCAYWIGFLMADGCVTSQNCLSVHLARRDEKHLEKLKQFMDTDRPLNYSFSISAKGTPQLSVTLAVKNKRIADTLKSYGIIERKTGKETSKFIPYKHLPSFFRGYIDGDGHYGNSINHSISLVSSSPNIINEFSKFIEKEIEQLRGCIRKIKNTICLTYNGRITCIKIVKILYKDASIFLSRKYEIIRGWLSEQETRIPVGKNECLRCGKAFFMRNSCMIYCSSKCRDRSYWDKIKSMANLKRREKRLLLRKEKPC